MTNTGGIPRRTLSRRVYFMEVVMGRALNDHQRVWSVVWGILSGVAARGPPFFPTE